jgi:DegV family protein with EDD domain
MTRIRIITDSGAELTPEEAASLGVTVLPLRYAVGNLVYQEGVDISAERLLCLIAEGKSVRALPPSTPDITSALESVARAGEVALCLHTAGGLVQVAEPVREVAENLFGKARIEIIDTLAASYALRRIVEAAAARARAGANISAVTQVVRSMMSRVYTVFYVERFEYVEETVQIQPAQAILASLLGLKPLVVLEDGHLIPLEKITPRTTPVDKLTDFVLEFATVRELAILTGPKEPDFPLAALQERLHQQLPEVPLESHAFGPLVASKVGPSSVGLYVFEGLDPGI